MQRCTNTNVTDFWAVLRTRRSIRRYRPEPVPHELIYKILEAAQWAPSAHNAQPWRFVIVDDLGNRERLATCMGAKWRRDLLADGVPADVIERRAAISYQRITASPVVIMPCLTSADMDTYPDPVRQACEVQMGVQSVAMATGNLLLAAHSLGLAACWLCAPIFAPDTVRAALDLPAHLQPQGLITLGYPAEVQERERAPLESRIIWR